MKDAPVEMGKGPVITIVDSSGRGLIASRKVVKWLKDAADAHSIPVQMEVGSGGTTDATAIHLTKGGIPSTTVSIPSRYIHSPVEILDTKDIEAGVKTAGGCPEAETGIIKNFILSHHFSDFFLACKRDARARDGSVTTGICSKRIGTDTRVTQKWLHDASAGTRTRVKAPEASRMSTTLPRQLLPYLISHPPI